LRESAKKSRVPSTITKKIAYRGNVSKRYKNSKLFPSEDVILKDSETIDNEIRDIDPKYKVYNITPESKATTRRKILRDINLEKLIDVEAYKSSDGKIIVSKKASAVNKFYDGSKIKSIARSLDIPNYKNGTKNRLLLSIVTIMQEEGIFDEKLALLY